ncbi:uncharacterized protein LOC133289101 [Gastrolobium bilobum]|uniref:uncharacterized protein LOC133289101 n=1 Tax=Gastrolobium bilobum TaxID=150636 RepID=UPI002AAF910B|nr:uncharacterized protein LOC133289101 [Gastrolobium bilobum]XP_061342958.1 uncharacterized protein LOC133289101 [Gastrolobium bilobum]XP_061342959.1 uncharacterized protein LOC133289101 [Gastrolobium bilobum]
MSSTTSSVSCCSGNSPSNLERFLQCVTPLVPSQTLPQSCHNDLNSLWQPLGKDTIEYFTLKDLWDCYYEWSAYGAGAPLMLESGDTAIQFYVPYLSAIQIYSNKSVAASRNRREDSDGVEFESDSWSDDSGSDNLSRSLSNNSSKSWDAVSEDSSCDQEGSWLTREKLGYLYLHYTEMSSPYSRVPLMEKIPELARTHPALMTLKSVDLSPASWMAVSWYPIYTIPSRKNDKDLEACFLTYHTLSSSFQDCAMECDEMDIGNDICYSSWWGSIVGEKCKKKQSGCISVPPFGLATYKMQGDLWLDQEPYVNERVSYLYSAADSWLKQLNVNHHDFNFFTSNSTM